MACPNTKEYLSFMNEKLTSVRRRQTTPLFEFAGIFLILASCASNDSAARTQTLTETAVTVPSGAFAIPAILADGTKVGNMVLGKTTLDDAMRMFPQQARYEGNPHAPNGYPTVRVGNNPPRPTLVYQP